MDSLLIIGIIVVTGFIGGEIAGRLGLPKVTGYILAGICLNPNLTHFIPPTFVVHTTLITDIALSVITFSVGGTLLFPKIRALGKPILYITLFEAEMAFLAVAAAFILLCPILFPGKNIMTWGIPIGVLLAAMAAPTDPSATLAVVHEYHASGDVTQTIMGVAALDDIFGLLNYSLAVSIAGVFIAGQHIGAGALVEPIKSILISVGGGMVFGVLFNRATRFIQNDTEGVWIAVVIGMLALCYGATTTFGGDALLATMIMGMVVVNRNPDPKKIFSILEQYAETLIFILFFTISTMHLDFSVLVSNFWLILLFVFFRLAGKFSGTVIGGKLSGAPENVRRYTIGGLVPQGGIVIGLALVIKQNPAFSAVADIILNLVIGATVIHEIIGPIVSKFSLLKAGEIKKPRP